ncbi:Olfactory receptor 2B11 [Lemmus lemmus]
MEGQNVSFPNTFVLVGFSDHPWLEMPLFGVLLVSFIFTVVGNSSIIFLSLVDPRLQTPMYFFLDNLSVLDLCVTYTIVPQLLVNLWGPEKTIASWSCVAQAYLYQWMGGTECALLAVMAFDRYVAVCCPLHYVLIMHLWACVWLAAVCWVLGLANSLVQVILTVKLPFCGQQVLNNFFCEVPAMIKLSCADTTVNDVTLAVLVAFFVLVPLALILLSYGFIARAVLRIQSSRGRHKAIGTCSSHLLVVSLFYLPAIYMYLQPPSSYSQEQGKFISLFYSIITPTLNPFIYTLRNKDVKGALGRLLARTGRLCGR